MSTVLKLVAAGLLCVLGLGLFVLGERVKQGEWDAAKVAEQEGKDAALQAAAAAIAKIEVKSVKYVQPVQTEIRTNTVYRDCQHSADSLRNLNALITGTEPTGDSGMPGAHAAR